MEVSVNGQLHVVHEGTTVADLVGALKLEPAAVATAVNGDFVARDRRAAHLLQPGDQVACIQPIVGG
jgi:sulfur carrier protein